MKPHKQTLKHDPDNGVWGDCTRTCFASILDLEIDEVPHFYDQGADGGTGGAKIREWLSQRGLVHFEVPFTGTVKDTLAFMAFANPFGKYLLGVGSPIADHSVVAEGGHVVHDPAGYTEDQYLPCKDGFVWVTILSPKL